MVYPLKNVAKVHYFWGIELISSVKLMYINNL